MSLLTPLLGGMRAGMMAGSSGMTGTLLGGAASAGVISSLFGGTAPFDASRGMFTRVGDGIPDAHETAGDSGIDAIRKIINEVVTRQRTGTPTGSGTQTGTPGWNEQITPINPEPDNPEEIVPDISTALDGPQRKRGPPSETMTKLKKKLKYRDEWKQNEEDIYLPKYTNLNKSFGH